MSSPLLNWSENFAFTATTLRRPGSVEELQDIVAAADRVKAVGSRHSFNYVADSPGGVLVDCSELGLSLAVDHDAMTAKIPGGWSYSRAVAALEAAGVALRNMASLPHISLAGGTATGTHGSGDTNQVLAAEIIELELVMADGSLRTFTRSDPEFAALPVGLGAFGIITMMTFAVEPSYQVRGAYYHNTTWDSVFENLDDLFASHYSVNMHAGFSEPGVRGYWCKDRFDESSPPLGDELFGATRNLVDNEDPGRTTPRNQPGPWSERLAHFTPEGSPSAKGDELQSSWFVDRKNAVAAINALRQIGDQIDPHLHGSEIRTVAADDLWLSPATGRDTLSIGFTWKKHIAEVHALLPTVEAALSEFETRPHWGKLFDMGLSQLREVFPKLDAFIELTGELDPDGTFSSPYISATGVNGRADQP